MEPLHLLLESCGDHYLNEIGNKYFKLKMRGMKPRALPTITEGAISALHRIIGRQRTGDVAPEDVGCVTRCLFEFSTNEKNEYSWQVFSDDIVVLLGDCLQILIKVSTRSNTKAIEKYLNRLLQLTDALSEKGPPLSTKLFRALARPLGAFSMKESMPQDLREMILDRLVTLLRSADKSSVYQTLSEMKPYLRGLAKLAFSCYIEAQIDIFQILLSSVRTVEEAKEAVGTWYSMHPKLQRIFLESFSKPFSEVSGQFVSEMDEIKESIAVQADRTVSQLAPVCRILQKPEIKARCDSSSKTASKRVHTEGIKGDTVRSFSDTLKQSSSMQHGNSRHGSYQQLSLKDLFWKHNSSTLHYPRRERRSLSLKKQQSESNKHELVQSQRRNQQSDITGPNSLLVEKNKGFTITQHLQTTLALQHEKQQYDQKKEAKRHEMNELMYKSKIHQTVGPKQGNLLENSKERKVQGRAEEVMGQEECVLLSVDHAEEEDEIAKIQRWLATSEPEVVVLQSPSPKRVDKPTTKVPEDHFPQSNCYHPPHEGNNNIPRAESHMKGMAHLHKSYQGSRLEGLSQSTQTIDRHKIECASVAKITRFPVKEEPREQRPVMSSQAREKQRKEREAKLFQANKEPGKPKEKKIEAREPRKQAEAKQREANAGPREERGAKCRKLREEVELTRTHVKSEEGRAQRAVHEQGKEQGIVLNYDAQKRKYGKKQLFTSRGVHDDPLDVESLISVDFGKPRPRFVLPKPASEQALRSPLGGSKRWEVKLKELEWKEKSKHAESQVKRGDIYDLVISSDDDISPKKKIKRRNDKLKLTSLARMKPGIPQASNLRGPITDNDILFDRLRDSSPSVCHQKSPGNCKQGPKHSCSRNWIVPDFGPRGITKECLRKKLKRPNYVEVSSTDGSLAGSAMDHCSVHVKRELIGNSHLLHDQKNDRATLRTGLAFKTNESGRSQKLSTKSSVIFTESYTKKSVDLHSVHEKKKEFMKPDESLNFSVEKTVDGFPDKVWESSAAIKGEKNHKDLLSGCSSDSEQNSKAEERVKISKLPKIDCIKKTEEVYTKTPDQFNTGNHRSFSTKLPCMDGTRQSEFICFQNVTPNDAIYKRNLEKEATYVQSGENAIIQNNAKEDGKTIQHEKTKLKQNLDSVAQTTMYWENSKKMAKPSNFSAIGTGQCVEHEQGINLSRSVSKGQKGKNDMLSASKEIDSGIELGSMCSEIFPHRSKRVRTEEGPPTSFSTPLEGQNRKELRVLKGVIGGAQKENENLSAGHAEMGYKLDLIKSSIDHVDTLVAECSLANKSLQDTTLRQKSVLDAAEDVFGPQNDKTFTPLLPIRSPQDRRSVFE